MSRRILLAAGGTGGHMFPAQALAEILQKQGWEIALMTDGRGVKHAGQIPTKHVVEVQAATISPKHPIRAISGIWKLKNGVITAQKFIKKWRPDIVVGFGGYPAYPALSAAQKLGTPMVLHEQNAVLGRVNRLFAARAEAVVSGFDMLEKLPANTQWRTLGNPLRAGILKASARAYKPPTQKINVLIIGGSLGARLLSETVPQAVALLPDDLCTRLNIVQQTRQESLHLANTVYEQAGVKALCSPFFSDIEAHLAAAHYVIARAGASSVSEIAVMGLPALFVPLAIAMDDHQSLNALPLKNLNAADILPESEFTPDKLKSILMERLNDSSWLETASHKARTAAKPEAAIDLAELVSTIATR
ncbi:MAG TPA: undecaprenyldiphospho-muramoylpentapeptide beta-N-acetylglucosaminyltransferase [Hellea balneolensis]|uniref:UDP-N-acetylglucosamine--N-acetylmuramyl-(pentapeptide) pyrophosphoryl-undecaprenol N-acetylglucosamine transferase n=1 Tax=Hellea balneolensis TaxID=287478 RepID=A0A7C3GAU7_9PROT|nr:undecaprenyldiphospho-muramoylpentapeptide beta-N-acetylglucosaminyltransferase [Hellea balneolensis]